MCHAVLHQINISLVKIRHALILVLNMLKVQNTLEVHKILNMPEYASVSVNMPEYAGMCVNIVKSAWMA